MIIKILFIQRICSYEGEYAPETLCCVDEFTDSDNPEYFEEEVTRQLEELKNEISSHSIIEIEVNDEKLIQILNSNPKLKGEIK